MTAAERLALLAPMLVELAGLAVLVYFRRQDRRTGCRPACVCGGAR